MVSLGRCLRAVRRAIVSEIIPLLVLAHAVRSMTEALIR